MEVEIEAKISNDTEKNSAINNKENPMELNTSISTYCSNTSKSITNYETTRYRYMVVKSFHEHHFIDYSASENTITATCADDDPQGSCYLTNSQALLTISAPSDLAYSCSPKAATLNEGYSFQAFPGAIISYQKWHATTI